jgi:predicted nucleic acid-binding protein
LLALSIDAKANFLITGDNDLLVLKTFNETQIVTISEFQTIITQS